MSDEIVVPLKYLSMAVTINSYENEQTKQIIEDELKLRLASMGAKLHNIAWQFYMGEGVYNCFATYYEVPK